MRVCKCTQCGSEFSESDGNPSVHYSTPAARCWRCELFDRLKPGDWHTDANGNHKQKPQEPKA